jgi:dipeptidase E
MRLAFYSDQEIAANAPLDARVLRLIGLPRPRIGYVSSSPGQERFDFARKRDYYSRVGAELDVYIDAESGDLDRELKALAACDAIHLSGGNTFLFLRWLKARSVLPVLRTYAREDRGVIIGASAGAILMTPSVATAVLCGDVRPAGPVADEALGLVDFYFWPHYAPGARLEASVRAAIPDDAMVYACEDGTGVVVDGDRVELRGAVPIALQPAAADRPA